jgi:glycosyltransferase involved in cell wall biosynthesis
MDDLCKLSVIIPTFQRPETLLRALYSLSEQTIQPDVYEVIVVDDGSDYDPSLVTAYSFPFKWQYHRQENHGATAARNNGVANSRGNILVFMDDDITAGPATLEALVESCLEQTQTIILGSLRPKALVDSPFFRFSTAIEPEQAGEVNFTHCKTGLLALKKVDFFRLGMLQDPTGGWPNWDDVDFGYRAYLAGFRFFRNEAAVAEHWDYAQTDLKTACCRWQRAGQSAVYLFMHHPGLEAHIPMFRDKTPIDWQQDNVRLVARKLARRVSSTKGMLFLQESMASFFEKVWPQPWLLRPLYRWVQGGYVARGYREGLKKLYY